ncbi:putative NRPS-like protein biosynthetic cluster, partial [Oleoguttula sp. CCFEE 5521]
MACPAGGTEAFALASTLTRSDDLQKYIAYTQRILAAGSGDRSQILQGIPCSRRPSYGPLATLSALLKAFPASWPCFELQQTYTKVWRQLPEAAKAGRGGPEARLLVDNTLRQCKSAYRSIIDMLHPSSPTAAIFDPSSGKSLSHTELARCVSNFRLPVQPRAGSRKPVIAISLPNGPLLALAVLSTATYYTAAPIGHGNGVGSEQFKTDVLQSGASLVLASSADVDRLALRDPWLINAGIRVLLVNLTSQMNLAFSDFERRSIRGARRWPQPVENMPNDISILLFTSGTSGKKKLVPLHVHSVVCGVAMVIDSWGLSPSMRCLNQMPFNHVGGLVRNLFAPIMSGGSVICCSAFDANLFWDCVEDYAPTWYYASPSMHQGILEAAEVRPDAVANSTIRLVCNAAGGLLPSLALQLRDTFSTTQHTTILPSYGMTECMPISTPPLTYQLGKTGTSGVSVGPEIAILDNHDQALGAGVVGRIGVRGSPVFSGYIRDNYIDTSCFTKDGWFDTGDIGYLDEDQYLYITGRSKEVINRGGELISPFEVEEAVVGAGVDPTSPVYGRISKALAFSVNHDVLQEVVGVAVVTPANAPRACLRGLQEAVKSTLSSAKVPVIMVYMDAGLPTNNNKLLRINLASRLGLPEIADHTPIAHRYYEADCPPVNTPLSTPMPSRALSIDRDCLRSVCQKVLPRKYELHVREDETDFYPELLVAPKIRRNSSASVLSAETLVEQIAGSLHGYQIPNRIRLLTAPLPRLRSGSLDSIAMEKAINNTLPSTAIGLSNTEHRIAEAFAQILVKPMSDFDGSSDFFDFGGDSMKAGRLLSALRGDFKIRLAIDALFAARTISALASLVDAKTVESSLAATGGEKTTSEKLLPGLEKTCSSSNLLLLILQLVPIGIMYPMKRALSWTIFIYCLAYAEGLPTVNSIPGRLLGLCVSIAIGQIVTKIAAPLLSIIFKWLVIGRYREGLYPMWGLYHTRWWMAQKVIEVSGMGVFNLTGPTRTLYLRMLGMKIGRNVSIAYGTNFGEYDLITIGDNTVIDRCKVRPFAAERNTSMYLGRISIGANASIGLAAIVAAGTSVPGNACIGPNSSSWEVADADEANRYLSSAKIPKPHWTLEYLLELPITALVKFCGMIPWLAALVGLVYTQAHKSSDPLHAVIVWFLSPHRVAYHYLALAAHACLGPVFFLFGVLAFKRVFDACYGRIRPGPAEGRSNMTKFRMQLIRNLMPAIELHKVSELFGGHYEVTSKLIRMMGGKVGKRVYWPGTGPNVQDWDLLEIGDDVVFGSRSHLISSDGTGSDVVKIGNGAMVADRVVLLPGAELGEGTVFGSGALTRRNGRYTSNTTWVGSRKNEAICLAGDPTTEARSTAVGRRTNQYYDTNLSRPRIPNLSTSDSMATLVQSPYVESGPPSPYFEKSRHDTHTYKHDDQAEPQRHAARRTSVLVRQLDSARSAESLTNLDVSGTPFGRAFYQGQASYLVWNQFAIFCYATFITVFVAVYWNAGSIVAIQIIGYLVRRPDYPSWILAERPLRPIFLYLVFAALITMIMAAQTVFAITIVVAAKWILMGRRKPGNY